jgi:hypothetical protein
MGLSDIFNNLLVSDALLMVLAGQMTRDLSLVLNAAMTDLSDLHPGSAIQLL